MLIVLDGNNLVRRQYHAGRGGSICRTAARLRHEHGGRVVIAWDSRPPYWRHDLFSDYKAHRVEDRAAQDFVRSAAREAKAEGVPGFYAEAMEADDVAATLVANADEECIVVSSDKDWCQMLEFGARWLAPERGGFEERAAAWVWGKFGVAPAAWPDFVALAGDSSDGIPGVPKIGPVRAAKLLAEHGTAKAWADSLADWGYNVTVEQIGLFKQIAALRTDAALKDL